MQIRRLFITTAALNVGAVWCSTEAAPTEVSTAAPEHVSTESHSESTVARAQSLDLITMTTPLPGFPNSASSRCTAEERAVWIANRDFGDAYQQAAAQAWGDSVDTVMNLAPSYPEVSRHCLSCLGDATACGRTNCFVQCVVDQTGEGCRGCINAKCIPALLTCTGASDKTELPMPPQRSVSTPRPSPRVRPSSLPPLTIQALDPVSSDSESSADAVSGPGRLRAASDLNGTTPDPLSQASMGNFNFARFFGDNAIPMSMVMAVLAVLYALTQALWQVPE